MAERISLKWNNYSTTLLNSLQKFQNKEQFCDSTIVCKENFYPVHRLLLSLCSEHFESIYDKATCKHPFVIISDIEPVHLKAILDFVYHGEVEIANDILPHFLKAAETLKIKGLTQDKNISHPKIENVKQQKTKDFVESRKCQSNDGNVVNRLPVVLNPILSLKRLDDSINLNDFFNPPPDDRTKKKIGAAEKEKYRRKTYLLHKKLLRMDNSIKSNTNYFHSQLNGDLKQDHNDDYSVPQFMEYDDNVTLTNSKCYSNLITNDQASEFTINSNYGACNEFETTNAAYAQIDDDDAAVKVELPEFSTAEDGYLESSSTFTVKSELFTEEEEYSNLVGCDYNSKVLENSFQDDLSTSQILGGRDSEINSFSHESLDERRVCFSSKGLMGPVLGDELQKQTTNCTLTKFDKHKCKFCPYVSSKRFLKFHESAHVSKYSYKCKFCWYRSVLKWNTHKHQECCYQNIIGKSLKVSLDSKIGLKNKKKAFEISLKSKHGKYKCHLCSYSSKYAGYLKTHQRAHTDKKLKCNLCSFTSIFKPVMTRHKLRVHMKFSSITNGLKIFQCRECPFSSKHRNVVDKHENCHTSHNLYKCGTCSYSANKRGYILRHELLHYAVQSKIPLKNSFQTDTVNSKSAFKKFKCELCQFSSKYKMVVSRHERMHTKKNLIKTQKCSGVTKRLTFLSKHKETNKLRKGSDHMTINKMYKCRICPYEADLNVRILQHETHHKIKKRHKCSKCSFSSDNIGRVNSHELLHNMIKAEKCDSSLSYTS